MAYANKREMSSNKTVPIVIVALLHVFIGYALVSGLAMSMAEKVSEDLTVFDVEEPPPPPPPPEEPPPPPEQPQTEVPPPVVSPPPVVRTNPKPPPVVSQPTAPPPTLTTRAPTTPPAPPAPPAPPPPPPPPRIEPAQPKANLNGLITGEDYPSRSLRNEEEGTVRVTLTVGTNGRVSGCQVVSSSGHSALDDQTCNLMKRRARFNPATDSTGSPTTGTHTQSFTWKIQGRR
ncbi:energy transducer TonB [Sphingomicrobium sp. XHP0235]|uniref:energy transducer TonB n=1 Tax=Sphingomicrobium aquimarinum TaxID=3133971 RepID=UPI0031FE6F87